jgi:hypothetical protein
MLNALSPSGANTLTLVFPTGAMLYLPIWNQFTAVPGYCGASSDDAHHQITEATDLRLDLGELLYMRTSAPKQHSFLLKHHGQRLLLKKHVPMCHLL